MAILESMVSGGGSGRIAKSNSFTKRASLITVATVPGGVYDTVLMCLQLTVQNSVLILVRPSFCCWTSCHQGS